MSKIIARSSTVFNKEIQVVKSLGLGTYIQVDGLTQSGSVVESIWKKTLKRLKNQRIKELKNCLILGLGGGSAAKWVRKYWPETKITGVEVDPVMVEMGRKYMGLDDSNVNIVIEDAQRYLLQNTKYNIQKFDLILVDVYVGRTVPAKFQTKNYIHLVRSLLTRGGVAVFNRLYFGDKRKEAMRFAEMLEKEFKLVDYFYPEANLMLICRV